MQPDIRAVLLLSAQGFPLYQPVHKALVEPLRLGGTGLTGGYLGKVGIYAALPAAEPLHGIQKWNMIPQSNRAAAFPE